MYRRILAVVLCVWLVAMPALAADRDRDRNSLKGIPKGHKHLWAVIGGTALGAGLGAIPGGTSNVFKGALIGGSAASAFWLAGHRHEEGPWSYVITNGALVAGIGWAVCDCGAGFGAGALIGGGGTALVQAFKTRHKGLAAVTGAGAPRDNTTPPPPPPRDPQAGQPAQQQSQPSQPQPQQQQEPQPQQPQQQPQQQQEPQPQQPQQQPQQQQEPQPQQPQQQPQQQQEPQPQQPQPQPPGQPPQNQTGNPPPQEELPDAPQPQHDMTMLLH